MTETFPQIVLDWADQMHSDVEIDYVASGGWSLSRRWYDETSYELVVCKDVKSLGLTKLQSIIGNQDFERHLYVSGDSASRMIDVYGSPQFYDFQRWDETSAVAVRMRHSER